MHTNLFGYPVCSKGGPASHNTLRSRRHQQKTAYESSDSDDGTRSRHGLSDARHDFSHRKHRGFGYGEDRSAQTYYNGHSSRSHRQDHGQGGAFNHHEHRQWMKDRSRYANTLYQKQRQSSGAGRSQHAQSNYYPSNKASVQSHYRSTFYQEPRRKLGGGRVWRTQASDSGSDKSPVRSSYRQRLQRTSSQEQELEEIRVRNRQRFEHHARVEKSLNRSRVDEQNPRSAYKAGGYSGGTGGSSITYSSGLQRPGIGTASRYSSGNRGGSSTGTHSKVQRPGIGTGSHNTRGTIAGRKAASSSSGESIVEQSEKSSSSEYETE